MDKEIKSIKGAVWKIVLTKYSYFLWGTPIFLGLSVWLGIYFSKTSGNDFNFWFVIGPFIPILILWGHLNSKIRHKFFEDYSKLINFEYLNYGSFGEFEGSLFKIGNERRVSNLLKGKILEKDTKIFDYSYTIGSGKNKSTYYFTIIEIVFNKSLPLITLKEKENTFFSLKPAIKIKDSVPLKLEGDFNKYFDLEVEKEFEIEALQIFTPDLMAELCDKWKHLSLESSDDRIYIYENRLIDNKDELDSLFNLAKEIVEKLVGMGDFISRDVSSLRNIINKQND